MSAWSSRLRAAAAAVAVSSVVIPVSAGAASTPRLQHAGAAHAVLRASSAPLPALTARAAVLRAQPAASTPRSTWLVTYTGFTPQAQSAFQSAVDIWAGIVASPVPIKVSADFTAMPTGQLGYAGASQSYSGAGLGDGSSYYPSALADAMTDSDVAAVNGLPYADIDASFSSTEPSFYFGTDGHPGPGQIDFESVVLHELGHGLGFAGGMSYSAGVGTEDFRSVFDNFAVSGTSTRVQSLSGSALGAALTSGAVSWDGPQGLAANSGSDPVLYAPGTWQDGSSFSHLDEATYPAGNPNALMTPYIQPQEVIHSPGPLVVAMLRDEGWVAALPSGGPLDTTPPTVTLAALPSWSVSRTVSLRFTGADTGSGIASYAVRTRRAAFNAGFGPLSYPAGWQALTATSLALSLSSGYTYCVSVRAVDLAGNPSAWSPERCVASPVDDRTVTPSSGWTRGSGGAYYDGTVTLTRRQGTTLTRTAVQARRLALVVTTCASCGAVSAYWNGVLIKTLSLVSATTQLKRTLTVADFGAGVVRTGTFVLKSASSRPVYVDAVGISRV